MQLLCKMWAGRFQCRRGAALPNVGTVFILRFRYSKTQSILCFCLLLNKIPYIIINNRQYVLDENQAVVVGTLKLLQLQLLGDCCLRVHAGYLNMKQMLSLNLHNLQEILPTIYLSLLQFYLFISSNISKAIVSTITNFKQLCGHGYYV